MSSPKSRVLAEDIASRLLARAGLDPEQLDSYPKNLLSSVAACLNVKAEFSGELLIDGRSCYGSGKTTTVQLSSTTSETRAVFTYAHELAHVALRKFADDLTWVSALTPLQTERLCDSVAAAMILPRSWLVATMEDKPSIPEILTLARAAHVSPMTVGVRLNDIGIDLCYMRFRPLRNRRWISASAVGVPHEVRRLLAPTGDMLLRLESTPDGSSGGAWEVVQELLITLTREHQPSIAAPGSLHQLRDSVYLLISGLRCSRDGSGWRLAVKGSRGHRALVVESHLPGHASPIWLDEASPKCSDYGPIPQS
ncbi:MAG: ImmA/IrrE family metallo-endopeptidase [Acidimicrobiales bacterium]